jgi:N-acetylmuramoyl-L-alanine amidase
MEIREWRRLAIQSVSLLLAVFFCCVVFAARLQQKTEVMVSAEEKPQTETVVEEKQDTKAETKGEETKKDTTQEVKGVVVIDAGHGGMDEGTSSQDGRYLEKDYALIIVKRLKKLLEEENVTVYYTRMADKNISKEKRTKKANQLKADLFISVHCNASSVGDTTANGLETLYSKRQAKNSSLSNKKLAQIMLDELTKATGLRERGVINREQLYLLHHSEVPTTIVEIGYMSSKKDLKFIKKKSGQQKIAQGICDGIMRALEAEK